MSAFWRKKKKEEERREEEKSNEKATPSSSKKTQKKTGNKKTGKKKEAVVIPEEKASLVNKILQKPLISEAVMRAQELGKYTFMVNREASKKEVALAVEAMYKVTVEKVNIMNYKGKSKFFRGKKGRTNAYKKAIVTLKKGEEIKLFS